MNAKKADNAKKMYTNAKHAAKNEHSSAVLLTWTSAERGTSAEVDRAS